MVIQVDLSQQEYQVFKLNPEITTLKLKNKNFVFGKNGTGKSTICKLIENQFQEDYNVQIFSGFQNVVTDNKLNAIVLGKENIEAKESLKSLEQELKKFQSLHSTLEREIKSLEWVNSYMDLNIGKHTLRESLEDIEGNCDGKAKELDSFYRDKASELKNHANPQITKTSYNKNDFFQDIIKSNALNDKIKLENETLLNETTKDVIKNDYKIKDLNIEQLFDEVNKLLVEEISGITVLKEIKDNVDKKNFAQKGLELHKAGDYCSFCANKVTKERIVQLESLVPASEVQNLQKKIGNQLDKLNELFEQVKSIKEITKYNFYSSFHNEIDEINEEIRKKKREYKNILVTLINGVEYKNRNLFKSLDQITLSIPVSFNEIESEIHYLIEKQNEWTNDLEGKQKKAREELRLHYVAVCLAEKEEYKEGWKGYEVEKSKLDTFKAELERIKGKIENEVNKIKGSEENLDENTIFYLNKKIKEKEIKKEEILQDTKNTQELVKIINNKLKSTGKQSLELTLVRDENEIEHYQIKDGENVRSIEKISTGERNIIAFLYFLESLSGVDEKDERNKIILLDDPINSNDDTMQYLIITEIQKLYTNKFLDKYNSQKDYFICLTHNAHFYLNLQPQGNFKEEKIIDGKKRRISKYDKNNFYRIENGGFKHIVSQKDDFNTHYDSLWIELKALYDNNLVNSILNSMRRIVETYTKFNKINPTHFYKDKEEHKKLFDVNSHSIDDHSMEVIGKDKNELLEMFRELFESNDAQEHFDTHWD